ncbi:MAG: 16S rRNA (adenine(1518)-N(6)/adenine(1519)-N(6))-dimethyltransferase RsmA [Rickettsiaceae bacterium H1]|nr:16S rRNA (adenine(1518)-N(6)/adenine(1519)-N(6))-dimethyltransferase RsmA [Rickettsiaceae bacterium H1]
MKAKKHFGQHFLLSDDVIKNIVDSSGEILGENILEIGPGTGKLTGEILSRSPAKLCSVEIDKDFLPYHDKLLSANSNYQLIFADALIVKENEFLSLPIKVISNLPYNISTELLFKWLGNTELFSSLILMFQKEVAERISASHGSKKYGKLSIITQLLCKVEYLFDIPNELFLPLPKVDSAVVKITPYKKPLFEVKIDFLRELIRLLFCYRRKMIHTILKKKFHNIEKILQELNINMDLRPENLSIKQLCDLTNALKE